MTRTHSLLACRLLSGILLLVSGTTSNAEDKKPLAVDDVYRMDAVQDLVTLPDGKTAFYVRQWNERGQKWPRQALWRVEGRAKEVRPCEEGEPDARKPVLSPDGKWLAFVSTRPLAGGSPVPPVPEWCDPATSIWLMPTAGGKAIPLAGSEQPYGRAPTDPFYARVAFSPDGKQLAFVADDGRDVRGDDELASDVTIVREDQGEGYEGYRPLQIWGADLLLEPSRVAASRVRRLTSDASWYGDPQWSLDGKSLIVHANRTKDRESVRFSINKNFELWKIDVASGKLTALTTGPGPDISPRVSPDGKHVLSLTVPRKGPHADVYNLLITGLGKESPRRRTVFEFHRDNVDLNSATGFPVFPLPDDPWLDEHTFYIDGLAGCENKRLFFEMHENSGVTRIEAPESFEKRRAARKELSPPSNVFLQDRLEAKESIVTWKGRDGLELDGVLLVPHESIAKAPFKVVVFPHGGPHGRSGMGFNFPAHLFAAHGYAVFLPNFRGSTGYGKKFLDADRKDFGGGDADDVLSGIDELVRKGTIDRDRQFVFGTSYGGYMTCWLIGHTKQFRAAAPVNAVTDLSAMWGLSDIQSWTEWEFGGKPWEVPDLMRKHSPITYVGDIRTPTLILHSDHDRRCPIAMGRMFYRSLERAGVETEMVVYHNERHGIAQPPHLEDLYRRVLAWFAKHDVQ